MSCRIKARFVLLFFASALYFSVANAQTLINESFEGNTFPPSGWTLQNASAGNNWSQNTSPANAVSGTKSMQVLLGVNYPNAWAITPPLYMTAGSVYRVSYWYKTNVTGFPKKLNVTIGNAPNYASQTTTLRNITNITNVTFVESIEQYTATANGVYYIGFNGTYPWNSGAGDLFVDSIVIRKMPSTNCNGTPVLGAITGPTSSCPGMNFTLNLGGSLSNDGLSFQWQSSNAGMNSFTDIVGANGVSLITSQSTAKDYRCVVTCTPTGSAAVSNIYSVALNPGYSCGYCTPTSSNCNLNDVIRNVSFAGINNSSTCSSSGYADYSQSVGPATIARSTSYPISVTVGPGGTEYVASWIDYNQSGTFDVNEFVSIGSGNGVVINSTINVPASALDGLTRMRVRVRYNSSFASSDACTGYSYGETEDYLVNIIPPPLCNTPIGGTTTSTAASVCVGTDFTLATTGSSQGSGFTYQWQSSTDGNVWVDIPSATGASLITRLNATSYYRRKITCANSGLFDYSTTLQVVQTSFLNCYCVPSASTCISTLTIDSVGINNLSNVSGCGVNGYANFTATTPAANVVRGTYQTISVRVNNTTTTSYIAAWIDLNHDGVFSSTPDQKEFFDIGMISGSSTLTKKIKIPVNALLGLTRIRIKRSGLQISSYASACYPYGTEETEDYNLNILPNPNPSTGLTSYVKSTGSSTNDGSSWSDAYNSIGLALANSFPGDTIKVAKGIYKEKVSLLDSVIILGGYPATGNPSEFDRNWGVNQTIISGATGAYTDPQYRQPNVIEGYLLSSMAVFDGFIVQDGSGSNTSNLGVGINLKSSNARINNTIFRKNVGAYQSKYTVACDGGSPRFTNCFFENNDAFKYSIVFINGNSSAIFANCVFSNNRARNIFSANSSKPNLINCTFFKNATSGTDDTALTLRPTIVFSENNAVTTIHNTILFYNFNNYSTDSVDIGTSSSVVNITNSITQNYNTGNPSFLSVNPKFRDTSSVTGPDGLYFTSDDGLQLTNPCSIGLNNGTNIAVSGIASDILGNPRIYGSVVDLGAYEVQSNALAIPATIYVNAAATGLNDGTSWANAYTDLQRAMLACSDTIKIAAGSYAPSINNTGLYFQLERNRVIYGGYPSAGNPDDSQRNPLTNITTLTGKVPMGYGSGICLRGISIDSTSVVDGVTISGSIAISLSRNASPLFRNTIIKKGNNLGSDIGLLAQESSNPVFLNCTFTQEGNGIYPAIETFKMSNPRFIKCIFKNNATFLGNVREYNGGVFYNDNSNPVIDSCLFQNNTANDNGGCMYNINNSNPIISNTRFYGNKALKGADIYNIGSSPLVTNCLFSDSSITGGGSFIHNISGSNPIFTNCQFRNEYANNTGKVCDNDFSNPTFVQCAFITNTSNTEFPTGFSVMTNINYSSPKLINCVSSYKQKGLQASFMANAQSSPKLVNCTIMNTVVQGSQVLGPKPVFQNYDSSIITLQNTIVWSDGGAIEVKRDVAVVTGDKPSSVVATNCILQDHGTNGVNGNYVGVNPRFLDITDPDGPDNKFLTADDGFGLCSCSPAINKGANGFIAGYSMDILANSRLIGQNVDIGAIEYQSAQISSPKTYYVNALATGNNDGSSWQDAYKEFSSAMKNTCSDTIKVAMGIYKPSVASRDSSFVINRNLIIYGGYPNNGNPSDSMRNPDLFPTVLSGDVGVPDDSTDNAFNVMRISCWDSTVLIDGLTFVKGNSNDLNSQYGSYRSQGGGIFVNKNKDLSIKRCRFLNNFSNVGSGIGGNGKLNISNCQFAYNNSSFGTFNVQEKDLIIKNCVFENNVSSIGGGIYCSNDINLQNCIFYKNSAQKGAGVYLGGDYLARLTNCIFLRNNLTGLINVGAGLFVSGYVSSNEPEPVIRNCIFAGNSYMGYSGQNLDWVYYDYTQNISNTYKPLNIKYSVSQTVINPVTTQNIYSITFKDSANPIGLDGIWFTADDGLQIDKCSDAINSGDNTAVADIPVDILNKPRIKNTIVDIGAYEYQPTTPDYLLDNAGDSMVANIEKTGADGWTHYYKDCFLLLSIKKGTQQFFGRVGDGTFRVVVYTTPSYKSGRPINLSSASYVTPGLSWNVMNRNWKIVPTRQLTDSVLIRFPFYDMDYREVKSTLSSVASPQQMVFFKVNEPFGVTDTIVPTNKLNLYFHNNNPSTNTWKHSMIDSVHYAEFYVDRFGSGTAGLGTGQNYGPYAANSLGCVGANRIFIAEDTGATYAWQVDTGSGYMNIINNPNYSGSNTRELTIIAPSSSWYGYTYRCLVNGTYNTYRTLKFQNVWTGNVSNAWEDAANWSCGMVPDPNTDVVINSGSVLVSSNSTIRSLKLGRGVNFSIASGYNLTITH